MKKIMTLVAILGFGMMVGCGPEVKPTTATFRKYGYDPRHHGCSQHDDCAG